MNNKKIYFIGIGGSSMSLLAFFLHKQGFYVFGSDVSCNYNTKYLQNLGVKIFDKHCKNNIVGADVVVYNGAIDSKNNEIVEAKKRGLQILSRAEILYEISKQFECVVSVAGAHGKTSTCCMIYSILKEAKKSVSLHIGSHLQNCSFEFFACNKQILITEACEYKDSFLTLKSDVGVVLNVEREHLDYFKNYENIKSSFCKFAQNCKFVICGNIDYKMNANVFYEKELSAKNIKIVDGKICFDVFYLQKYFCHIVVNSFAKFNISNALAAIAVAIKLNISKEDICNGLAGFVSPIRRMEKIADNVFLDYAHHPSEIAKSIESVKEAYKKDIVVVFQPHTFSRTKTLLCEFERCFKDADKIVLFKTYSAREMFDKEGSAYFLFKKLKENNQNVYYAATEKHLQKLMVKKSNCILLFLGAGNIDEIARNVCKEKTLC